LDRKEGGWNLKSMKNCWGVKKKKGGLEIMKEKPVEIRVKNNPPEE